MPADYTTHRHVEFADTDMAGMVHFANYLQYMEAAEHAFFASLGFPIFGEVDGVRHGWPRVHVACRYMAPLRFEERVEIRTIVHQIKSRAIEFVHLLYRLQGDERELAAVGRMTILCVRYQQGEMQSCPIPPGILEALQVAPADTLAGIVLP